MTLNHVSCYDGPVNGSHLKYKDKVVVDDNITFKGDKSIIDHKKIIMVDDDVILLPHGKIIMFHRI